MQQKNLETALAWAAFGVPVFPTRNKHPLTEHGVYDATENTDTIKAWFYEPSVIPALHLGAARLPLSVVDLDPPTGIENWVNLQIAKGFANETFQQETPRGGRHLFFLARWRNSTGALGPNIDTRGAGGYVLAYAFPPGDWDAIAPGPVWIEARLATGSERSRKIDTEVELDKPSNISAAIGYLVSLRRREDFAVRYGERNSFTYRTAALLFSRFALTESTCAELIAGYLGPCYEGWADHDYSASIVKNHTL